MVTIALRRYHFSLSAVLVPRGCIQEQAARSASSKLEMQNLTARKGGQCRCSSVLCRKKQRAWCALPPMFPQIKVRIKAALYHMRAIRWELHVR